MDIPLTQGFVAKIDNRDRAIRRHRWHAVVRRCTVYAGRMATVDGKRTLILMHRQIAGTTDPTIPVDHKDGDGLNNRRRNLRISSARQNARNTVSRAGSTSRFLGVCWDASRKRWRAEIRIEGRKLALGRHHTEEGANAARLAAERTYWGIEPRRVGAHG